MNKKPIAVVKTFYLSLLIVAVIQPLLNGSAHDLATVRDSPT